MTSTEPNAQVAQDLSTSAQVAAVSDEIPRARWWALLALAVWLAAVVAWLVRLDQVTGGEDGRSSIDWLFLLPCALVAALVGAVQAGRGARWWGALLVLGILGTVICLIATFLGTPRDWWRV